MCVRSRVKLVVLNIVTEIIFVGKKAVRVEDLLTATVQDVNLGTWHALALGMTVARYALAPPFLLFNNTNNQLTNKYFFVRTLVLFFPLYNF